VKRILLVELDYHAEVLRGFYLNLSPHFFTAIYTTREIFDKTQLEVPDDTLHLKEKLEIGELSSQFDLILFTTAQKNFKYKLFPETHSKVAVVVHNINSYFYPRKIGYPKSFYWLRKDLSFILRVLLFQRDLKYKSKFLKSVNYFLMPSQFMASEALKSPSTSLRSKVISSPIEWVPSPKNFKRTLGHTVIFTIVGSIDPRRKDYSLLEGLLQCIAQENKEKVRFILAGQPFRKEGKKILKRLKLSADSNGIDLKTYESFVPETELERILSETHYLIAPIKRETRHHIWLEEYGKTKISGNINDTLRFKIPTLLPSWYFNGHDPSNMFIPFESQYHLNKLVDDITLNPSNGEEKNEEILNMPNKNLIQVIKDLIENSKKSHTHSEGR